MKPPKLRPNESSKSFKARVKAWEKATGRKFPRTFAGKTDEERVLGGAVRNTGLNKPKDYSTNYGDEIKESQTQKARTTQASKSDRQVKDEDKESFLERAAKTDYSKVKLPNNKLKVSTQQASKDEKGDHEWGENEDGSKRKRQPSASYQMSKYKPNKEKLKSTKMHSIEKKNREIHGDKAVDRLKQKHKEWKKARKAGKLDEWKKKWKKK